MSNQEDSESLEALLGISKIVNEKDLEIQTNQAHLKGLYLVYTHLR